MRGLQGAALSRHFIREAKRKEEQELEDFFDRLAQNNMQSAKLNHIQNLLTKDFSERQRAYEIKSKISPKQRRRVH